MARWYRQPLCMWRAIYRSILVLACVILALRLADRVARRMAGPLPPVPHPNGYELLVKTAREAHLPQGELAEASQATILKLAETNRAAVTEFRKGLRQETAVTLSTKRDWDDEHEADLKRLKRMAIVLGMESRAQQLQGQTNAAARCVLDIILLGQALGRGGLLPDAINGLAVETLGYGLLRAQAPTLDTATCRELAQELERAEARRESPDQLFRTDKTWSFARFGLIARVGALASRDLQSKRRADFEKRYNEVVRRTRRLTLLLAARAVQLEAGKPVTSPTEVVPSVLQRVPEDPANNTPFTDVPGTEGPA